MDGTVFNIQRFSLHDGPGIRTTVFLKGCRLSCLWCHNPESMNTKPELQYFAHKCISCGKCVDACPVGAHRMEEDRHGFDRRRCAACGKCAIACYAEALILAGKRMDTEEVMAEVAKDGPFYVRSGGGVTFSGGEPLMQPDFLRGLLDASKKMGLRTAVDTAGYVPWKAFEDVCPLTDLFLFDVKTADTLRHRQLIGADNELILDNLSRLSAAGASIWIRIPTIPGVNDTEDAMRAIAEIVAPLRKVLRIELMPYHAIGKGKYEALGRQYGCTGIEAPHADTIARLKAVFAEYRLPIV